MHQLTLTLIGGLAKLPLFARSKRMRRPKTGVFVPWSQFPLKLTIHKLIRKCSDLHLKEAVLATDAVSCSD